MRFGVYVGEGDARRRILIQFENGAYGTEDEVVAAGIDKLLEERPTLRRSIRKADVAAAEAAVRAHMARNTGGATKGAFTTQNHPEAMVAELATKGVDLQTAREHAAAMSGDKMLVQQDVPQTPHPQGFTPDVAATNAEALAIKTSALDAALKKSASSGGGTKV